MSQVLQKGANAPLPTGKIVIRVRHKGPDADLSALLLNAGGKVPSDSYFVFYGNDKSPEGSVLYVTKNNPGDVYNHELSIDLPAVPAEIDKIALTLTIDPTTPATFGSVKDCVVNLVVGSSNEELVQCLPTGTTENAFIVAEVYRRQEAWKVRHVSQGFNNGLKGVATAFGVTIEDEPAATPAPAPTPAKVNLSKVDRITADLEKKGSRLVDLQKSAAVSLKKHRLDNIVARVIMVLDASGSTTRMWPHTMQAVLDRLATLSLNLDDNGELEFWGYAGNNKQYANVTLANLDGYISRIQSERSGGFFSSISGILPGLGYDNNEPPVMKEVLKAARETPKLPTLCIFVTDGGINKDRAIQDVLKEASHHPVFWQFVGLGGSSYGILERFDTMTGRKVDNAGFFAIDDYSSVSETELYDRILKEFPTWLAAARSLGIIQA